MSFFKNNAKYMVPYWMSSVITDIMAQQQNIIIGQLNDLIKDGLLTIETGPAVLVHSEHSDRVELKQSIDIKVKDQEYIKTLEKENRELKARMNVLSTQFNKATLVQELIKSGLLSEDDIKKALEDK